MQQSTRPVTVTALYILYYTSGMEFNFSVNSMNGLESEIGTMLSTLGFQNLDDVTKSSFSTVNKNVIVYFANSLAGLLKRSHNILKMLSCEISQSYLRFRMNFQIRRLISSRM